VGGSKLCRQVRVFVEMAMATSEPLQPAGGEHGGTKRLNALRHGEGLVFDDAYLGLRRELEAYARAAAGARAGEADFQPESIVADALARGMRPALAACDDDEHLAGWLKVAVRHELLDEVVHEPFGDFGPGERLTSCLLGAGLGHDAHGVGKLDTTPNPV
jgi:hypothetical protein